MKRSLLCFLLSFSLFSFSPSTFIREYLGVPSNNIPIIYDLKTTSDTGFLMVGYNQDPNSIQAGLLMKTDRNGLIQWSKSYSGGVGPEYFQNAFVSVAGIFYTAGFSFSNNQSGDFWISAINSSGALSWSRNLTGPIFSGYYDYARIRRAAGTDLIAGATLYDSVMGGLELVKYNVNGNFYWAKTYKDSVGISGITLMDMVVKNDSNYLLLGLGSWNFQEIVLLQTDS